jgi:lysyl-tRNA synthetase class 2
MTSLVYPYNFDINCSYNNLMETVNKYNDHEINEDKIWKVQCRVMLKRCASSKLYFLTVNILNSENLVNSEFQIVISKNMLYDENDIEIVKKITLGDIIGVEGYLGKTKVGENSIFVKKIILLAPCLHDLPKEQYISDDPDVKYRQRYLDMIINPKTRFNLITRSKIIKYIRNYLDDKNYLEVETPILNTNYGGANAKPFITHHNDYKMEMFLRIAPELFLKQLVIGGLTKIYEIGKQFRNESVDQTHNPEFTSIEIYTSPADYNNMFDLCENLIKNLVKNITGSYKVIYKGIELDFEKPFNRIDFLEELRIKTEYHFNDLESETSFVEVKNLLEKYNIKCAPPLTMPRMLDKLAGEFLETQCVQPTFIFHHPKIMSPLAKPHRLLPNITERFELFILEKEYANAYTELNDPTIQKEAFMKQSKDKNNGDSEAQPPDLDFVKALEYGLPPTGGLGLGIDRLVMLLTNQDTIREILCFPTMK